MNFFCRRKANVGPGRHKSNANSGEAELPRLTGTKSQASTASSSATRDSGISVNDVQKAAESALSKNSRNNSTFNSQKRQSKAKSRHGSSVKNSANKMISVDDLPVSGRAMPLGRRPGTNRSSIISAEISVNTNFDSGNESRSTTASTGGPTGMAASRIRSITNAEFEKRPPLR